ncbi:MAG TPA: DUF6183 family protein, partial [Labilithrix sp.]
MDIDAFVNALRGQTKLDEPLARIKQWVEAGATKDLVACWDAVEAACEEKNGARLPYEAACDEIEEQLALAKGDAALGAVLELLERDRVKAAQRPRPRDLRTRAAASRLAATRTREDFLAALAKHGGKHRELFACWMHEIVLRSGNGLRGEASADAFARELEKASHPLAGMPLVLLAAEREAPTYMPMYGEGAFDRAVARLEGGPTSARTIPPPGEGGAPKATRIADDARLLEAFLPWTRDSNGRIEAGVFTIAPAVDPTMIGRWLLRALDVESSRGDKLVVRRVQADFAWGALFGSAANGGAYSTGLGGAYGRRAAWTTLAGLAGAPAGAPVEKIDELAEGCTFLSY